MLEATPLERDSAFEPEKSQMRKPTKPSIPRMSVRGLERRPDRGRAIVDAAELRIQLEPQTLGERELGRPGAVQGPNLTAIERAKPRVVEIRRGREASSRACGSCL